MCILELPVETIRGLSNLEIFEKQSATFECEFNKPNLEVKWFQAGDHITPDWTRFKPEVDGKVHRLIISDAELDDEAKYSCRANGKKTSGMLKVKGKKHFILHIFKDFTIRNILLDSILLHM